LLHEWWSQPRNR